MGIEVACGRCHRTFPADTHAGLVRCGSCEERTAPRMEGAGDLTIEFDAGDWR